MPCRFGAVHGCTRQHGCLKARLEHGSKHSKGGARATVAFDSPPGALVCFPSGEALSLGKWTKEAEPAPWSAVSLLTLSLQVQGGRKAKDELLTEKANCNSDRLPTDPTPKQPLHGQTV